MLSASSKAFKNRGKQQHRNSKPVPRRVERAHCGRQRRITHPCPRNLSIKIKIRCHLIFYKTDCFYHSWALIIENPIHFLLNKSSCHKAKFVSCSSLATLNELLRGFIELGIQWCAPTASFCDSTCVLWRKSVSAYVESWCDW